MKNSVSMKVLNWLASFAVRSRKPVFGPKIFAHRPWLSRQVDEQMRKRAFNLD
jgi:hypothetical protein